MTLRKTLTITTWTIAIALSANAVRLWGLAKKVDIPESVRLNPSLVEPHAVRVTPYTVIFESHASAKPGATAPSSVSMTAVRGDGSIVRRIEVFGDVVRGSSRLLVFADGRIITTDDLAHTRTTSPNQGIVAVRLRDPASNCLNNYLGVRMNAKEKLTGKSTFLGYPVEVVTTESSWASYAPSLGCAQLRYEVTIDGGDTASNIATKVIPGEPLAELFVVPANYKEVPPQHGGRR